MATFLSSNHHDMDNYSLPMDFTVKSAQLIRLPDSALIKASLQSRCANITFYTDVTSVFKPVTHNRTGYHVTHAYFAHMPKTAVHV